MNQSRSQAMRGRKGVRTGNALEIFVRQALQKSGSVEEKLPSLVYNTVFTGVPTIILIDGGGFRPKFLDWLRKQAGPSAALRAVWRWLNFSAK